MLLWLFFERDPDLTCRCCNSSVDYPRPVYKREGNRMSNCPILKRSHQPHPALLFSPPWSGAGGGRPVCDPIQLLSHPVPAAVKAEGATPRNVALSAGLSGCKDMELGMKKWRFESVLRHWPSPTFFPPLPPPLTPALPPHPLLLPPAPPPRTPLAPSTFCDT